MSLTTLEPDYRASAREWHCPQCGKPMRMTHTRQNHTGRDSYRVRCADPRHYLGPWKPTEQAAYAAAKTQLDGESS